MKKDEWLGLNTVRTIKLKRDKKENVPVTDEYAIAYAAKKFGVSVDDIELRRTDGCILVRVVSDTEDVELPSFDEYMLEMYPIPIAEDEFYEEYIEFGYNVYLSNAYPDVWRKSGVTWGDIRAGVKVDYHWYCIGMAAGCTDAELDDSAVESFLTGQPLVISTTGIPFVFGLKIPVSTTGILVWEDDPGNLCVFLLDFDYLLPIVCKEGEIEILDETFGGWEE